MEHQEKQSENILDISKELDENAENSAQSTQPKMSREDRIKAEVKTGLRSFLPVLRKGAALNLNESDTCDIITDTLKQVLGYDIFDITSEHRIRSQYVDFAVKSEGNILFLIEVKSMDTSLNERHLNQAGSYAANEGIDWVVLTTGIEWHIYNVRFEKPVTWMKVASVNLLGDDSISKKADILFMLTKYAFQKDVLKSYYNRKAAISPSNIAQLILSDKILDEIRRAVKRESGYQIKVEEVRDIISGSIFKDDKDLL